MQLIKQTANGYVVTIPTLDGRKPLRIQFEDTEVHDDVKYSKAVATVNIKTAEIWGKERVEFIKQYGGKRLRSKTKGVNQVRRQASRGDVLYGFSQQVQYLGLDGKKQTFGFSEANFGKATAENLASIKAAKLRAVNTCSELNLHPIILRSLLGEYAYMDDTL